MENKKPMYCLTEHSERLAYSCQKLSQLLDRLQEVIGLENSPFDEVVVEMEDLFLDMIGVEKESSEINRDGFHDIFYGFNSGQITLNEFMRLANDEDQTDDVFRKQMEKKLGYKISVEPEGEV